MQKVREIAKQLHVLPRLRLWSPVVEGGKETGIEGNGPHVVTFLEEPVVVHGRDNKGAPRKEFRFKVQEGDEQYYWHVPTVGGDGQASYLIEPLMEVNVGEQRVLELKKGTRYYIEIRRLEEFGDPMNEEIPED